MTMPHLMNCDHSHEGWCLECVKRLHDECEEAKTAARTIYVNLRPACLSGSIVYDAPKKWPWITNY